MAKLAAFISYSSADEQYRKELDVHLGLLKRESLLETWTFRNIDAGEDWKSAIDRQLESADIILLLVSANFVNSDYCWNIEMRRALQRHREEAARVIPIIIRECDWSSAPFAGIQALPAAAKPVASWRPKDKAWKNVVEGIRRTMAAWRPSHAQSETDAVPVETPVQRAARLAADIRVREARDQRLRSEGVSAAQREAQVAFSEIVAQARQIATTTPELGIVAGARPNECIVRLRPLTLHCYPNYDPIEVEKSYVAVRLLYGGMVLPQESNIFFPEPPKELKTYQYTFRLGDTGHWLWYDRHSDSLLSSAKLAELAIHKLLELHDDIGSGKVKSPRRF